MTSTTRIVSGLTTAAALCAAPLLIHVTAPVVQAQDCARHLVSGGDDLPAGNEVGENERYPSHLIADHLKKWGPWCVYNLAKNDTSSATFITGGQLATTQTRQPDMITLSVGEMNPTIKDVIGSCFDKIKSHDFTGGSVCAASILGNSSLFSNLTSNLTTIQQAFRVIMAGRPKLVVAVTGYTNPYPKSSTATEKVAELCTPLIDTIPTCTARWVQLPPALDQLDSVIKKLNDTIEKAVAPFATGSAGRFVFVNTYDKTRDHCMKMEVSIKTTVEHPEEDGAVHQHDSPSAVNFGCDDPWYVAGSDGTDTPFYLFPAAIGILTDTSQTTSGMGVHPNDAGHKCISDLIWDADTIDPGVTPLKWKLGIPEPPATGICQ